MDDELLKKIEDIGEDLPEEASDFIFGGPLDAVSVEITTLITDENEKKQIVNDITFFLLGITSLDELVLHIDNLMVIQENKIKIKQLLQEKIIDELILLLEIYDEIEPIPQINKQANLATDPTPNRALVGIQQRLSQTTAIAPTKRDYSVDKPETVTTPPAPDPYREIPLDK